MSSVGPAVVFEWVGSLQLARALGEIADELDALRTTRSGFATTALTRWSGVFAGQFIERLNDEQGTGANLSNQLRAEADGWAIEWQKAMDQENRNRYAAAVRRVENQRGNVDKFVGWFVGHDDLPGQPHAARLPRAPGYGPTRGFANYSRY